MDRKTLCMNMVELANSLDNEGNHILANKITTIAENLSQNIKVSQTQAPAQSAIGQPQQVNHLQNLSQAMQSGNYVAILDAMKASGVNGRAAAYAGRQYNNMLGAQQRVDGLKADIMRIAREQFIPILYSRFGMSTGQPVQQTTQQPVQQTTQQPVQQATTQPTQQSAPSAGSPVNIQALQQQINSLTPEQRQQLRLQ